MVQMKTIESVEAIYRLLTALGAPPLLIQHLKLVGETAELLIIQLQRQNIPFDANWVRFGVAVHDAGKILHRSNYAKKATNMKPPAKRSCWPTVLTRKLHGVVDRTPNGVKCLALLRN
jgi:hypothetical protein